MKGDYLEEDDEAANAINRHRAISTEVPLLSSEQDGDNVDDLGDSLSHEEPVDASELCH
jgi:hypothetical protein